MGSPTDAAAARLVMGKPVSPAAGPPTAGTVYRRPVRMYGRRRRSLKRRVNAAQSMVAAKTDMFEDDVRADCCATPPLCVIARARSRVISQGFQL